MSIKGFSVGGVVQRYDYTALDNLPQGQGVSDDLKAALLQLAQKVAYIDDQGQTYYDDLYDALYPEKTLLSIAANFQQGQAVVYNTDSLDSLKQYLTVTAIYDDASTETVPSSAYTLSGTLTTGTSVITVTYEGKTDAFNVTVTAAPMSFPVTNNLTGCTTSNSASNVAEGSTYNAVITASSDYTLVGATVSITMGGTDITTSAYSGGVITISNVNGALIISVTAVERVLTSISAVYTQSGTVYDTDTLDSLKADLVVTANYSDSSTQTVPAADYTLSGTLTVGTSTITVSYGGKTTTFSVTVTENPIPAGYTVYDYVYNKHTNNNDISIDTQLGGEYCGVNYEHELTFLVTNAATSTSYPMYGLRSTTGSDPRARALWSKKTTNGNLACNYNGVDTGFVFSMVTNTKYKCVTGNNQWKMNDVVVQDNMDGSSYSPPSTGTIRLFGIQTGTDVRAGFTRHNMRIYGFKVTDLTTENVIADFVPVVDGNGTAGLYDIINRRFCTAIVASTIGAGND